MDLLNAIVGTLVGNFLTAIVLYVLYRLNKNERDQGAIWMGIAALSAVLVLGIAVR